MIVESGINPNCSELVIRLDTSDIDWVKKQLQTIGVEEVLAKNYYDYGGSLETSEWDRSDNRRVIRIEDLPEEALKLIERLDHDKLSDKDYQDLKKKLKDKYHIDRSTDSIMLSHIGTHPDYDNHSLVQLIKGFETEDRDDAVVIMANQHCQWQLFPVMKKMSDLFSAVVEPYDGGSIEAYKAWESGTDEDNYLEEE